MPSANLMAMQTAINRIAAISNGAVNRVTVDGGMGSETANATLHALVWVAQKNCFGGRCVPQGIADTADSLIAGLWGSGSTVDHTVVMQRNTQIAKCLNSAADVVGAPAGAPVSSGGHSHTPAPVASIKDTLDRMRAGGVLATLKASFGRLQPWQKALVGAGGALAVIFAVGKLSKRKAA